MCTPLKRKIDPHVPASGCDGEAAGSSTGRDDGSHKEGGSHRRREQQQDEEVEEQGRGCCLGRRRHDFGWCGKASCCCCGAAAVGSRSKSVWMMWCVTDDVSAEHLAGSERRLCVRRRGERMQTVGEIQGMGLWESRSGHCCAVLCCFDSGGMTYASPRFEPLGGFFSKDPYEHLLFDPHKAASFPFINLSCHFLSFFFCHFVESSPHNNPQPSSRPAPGLLLASAAPSTPPPILLLRLLGPVLLLTTRPRAVVGGAARDFADGGDGPDLEAEGPALPVGDQKAWVGPCGC